MKSATKKTAKKRTATKAKPKAKKGAAKPADGRDQKGRFVKGNKAAEDWTESTVMPILQNMWKSLTTNYNGEEPEDKNPVRANDIKLQGEICLMYDVDPDTWTHWKNKFGVNSKKKESGANELTDDEEIESQAATGANPVARLIKKICHLLEMRLIYSSGTMDMFVLKTHYAYKEQQFVDMTSKGEQVGNPFMSFLKSTGTIKTGGK